MLLIMEVPAVVLLLLTAFACRTSCSALPAPEIPNEVSEEARNATLLQFFFPRSVEESYANVARRRQLEKERFQSHIQKAVLSSINKSTTPAPDNDKLTHLTLYPSCVGPPDYAQWFPNGHQRFQFYFPAVPTSVHSPTLPFSHEADLFLRMKGPAKSTHKASTPSSGGSTPNDVDANLGASNDEIQINIVSPGVYFRQSHRILLSQSYPYARVPVLFFVASWMATHDDDPQKLEVTVSDPRTNETLNIGDYFVGMRCATSEPKLKLPSEIDDENPQYLEQFEDSFLDVAYSTTDAYTTTAIIRNTGINMRNLSRLPRSHHGKNNIEATGNQLRCNKRREYMSFAAAGSPFIIQPRGMVFVTCECSRVCDETDSKPCSPCEAKPLSTIALRVLEVIDDQLVVGQRTIPTDCGCF